MRPLPTAAPTVANAWPRETWWGLCRCEIVDRNSQAGQNHRRDNEYYERGRNQPEPMSARASSPHSVSSAAQLRRSPVTPTPPAGTSSHSTRTTGTLTLFAFRRQRAIADNEQDGSERTVSVPACLRAVQFAAVCSAPEAFTCRQIQPAAVRCSLPGWTSNPKAGGSNPPGRIELPANSSNLVRHSRDRISQGAQGSPFAACGPRCGRILRLGGVRQPRIVAREPQRRS